MPPLDTIVVGLGAMGACALAALARRGRRVVGLDRFDPPHARGSSHGGSRLIRLSYFEHPDYVPLLRHAYEGFDRLGRDAGERLRFETGLVIGGRRGNPVTTGMLASARIHDLPVEAFDGSALSGRFPQFTVPGDWDVVFEARGGFVRPEATIRAALASAVRHGAGLTCNQKVQAWGTSEAGVWVQTGTQRLTAGNLILAGGAWLPELLGVDAPELRPTRETLVWLDDAGDPLWQAERMPVWLFDRGDLPSVYGAPAFSGMGSPHGLKISLHGAGPTVRPEAILEPPDPAAVRAVVEAAATHVIGAGQRNVTGVKSCLYTMSGDGHFVLGPHPRQPRVLVAGGFSGHGFKFAPVIGEALADLAADGRTTLPIGFLAPTRAGARWTQGQVD